MQRSIQNTNNGAERQTKLPDRKVGQQINKQTGKRTTRQTQTALQITRMDPQTSQTGKCPLKEQPANHPLFNDAHKQQRKPMLAHITVSPFCCAIFTLWFAHASRVAYAALLLVNNWLCYEVLLEKGR